LPFARPLLTDLRQRVARDIMVRLPGTDALLRWNNLSIVAEVEAGIAHLLYGRLDWSFRQLFPDTAEGEYLERWASIWGIQRRPASRAFGTATWPASAGTFIPAGAIAIRGDRFSYTVQAPGAAVTPEGEITVRLLADVAGAIGNSAPDVQLTLATTINAVTPLGRVDDPGLSGGASLESDALLLQRLLSRIRMPPHGGNANDYLQWTLSVAGVTRAWVYPMEMGAGSVTVRFMTDGSTPDGIPTPADVARVQAFLDSVAPVTARVHAAAPIPQDLDVHIILLDPDTPEVRAGIEAELRDMLRLETEPGGLLFLSRIYARITAAPGVIHFTLLDPTADVQADPGHILVLGALSFV